MHISSNSKIWVLFDSESAGTTEAHQALKDVKYSVIKDISQGILLEAAFPAVSSALPSAHRPPPQSWNRILEPCQTGRLPLTV